MGLMQLMPSVAKEYKVRNAYDPAANIAAGVQKLKGLIDTWGVELALAAYNAGEGAVMKFNGIPPYRETQNYVKKILSNLRPQVAREFLSRLQPSQCQPLTPSNPISCVELGGEGTSAIMDTGAGSGLRAAKSSKACTSPKRGASAPRVRGEGASRPRDPAGRTPRARRVHLPALPHRRKVPSREFLVYNQELATLLKAGMPLVQSLDILRQRITNPTFKVVLDDMYERVRAGSALSESFEAHGGLFPASTRRRSWRARSRATSSRCCAAT